MTSRAVARAAIIFPAAASHELGLSALTSKDQARIELAMSTMEELAGLDNLGAAMAMHEVADIYATAYGEDGTEVAEMRRMAERLRALHIPTRPSFMQRLVAFLKGVTR